MHEEIYPKAFNSLGTHIMHVDTIILNSVKNILHVDILSLPPCRSVANKIIFDNRLWYTHFSENILKFLTSLNSN